MILLLNYNGAQGLCHFVSFCMYISHICSIYHLVFRAIAIWPSFLLLLSSPLTLLKIMKLYMVPCCDILEKFEKKRKMPSIIQNLTLVKVLSFCPFWQFVCPCRYGIVGIKFYRCPSHPSLRIFCQLTLSNHIWESLEIWYAALPW